MTENRDPVGSLSDDVELLERHISILKTVRENQPVGLIRLSEMTGTTPRPTAPPSPTATTDS